MNQVTDIFKHFIDLLSFTLVIVVVVVVILSHTRLDHNVNFCPGTLLTGEINLEAEAVLKLKQIKHLKN